MYVIRFPYRRHSLQRPASLTQLIAYLLNPKQDNHGPNHQVRLAGPPWGFRLIQRASPFGTEEQVFAAARDLSHQFFEHIHVGVKERRRPYRVYVHLAIGFPLDYKPRQPAKGPENRRRWPESPYFFWLAAVREILDSLGVDESLPQLIVMHDDRQHLHAHVVVALFAKDIDASDLYRRMTKPLMSSVVANFYPAHGWPAPNGAISTRYEKILQRCYGRAFST